LSRAGATLHPGLTGNSRPAPPAEAAVLQASQSQNGDGHGGQQGQDALRFEAAISGSLDRKGVALKINFAMSADTVKKGPHRSAVFGLSPELARGLAKALTTVLDTPTKPPEPKALVH